ncbi:MAG: N-6 DNA methylase [Planctomycetes bacterium]|nr:N-6 DNA methylase [Planctomycetota bacterium]
MTAGRSIVSISQTWCTPPKYIRAVREVFGGTIALDPCSNRHSVVKAETEYRLPDHDGLHCSWNFPTIYVNPPYGADRERGTTIKHWLRKCANAHQEHRSDVLALVPVATNTKHWKDYVFGVADALAFLYDTRLKFLVDGKDGGKGAPMSCCMIYWGSDVERFEGVFLPHGAVVDLRRLQGKPIGLERNAEHTLLFANGSLSGHGKHLLRVQS